MRRKTLRRITRRIPRINGRRGAFQLLFSIVFWMLAGMLLIAEDFTSALAWLGKYFDGPAPLGYVWVVSSATALAGAFVSRPRDWFSFAALTFTPFMWGCLYLIGAFIQPNGRTALGAVLYFAFAGAVMVASGMTGDRDRDIRETQVTP